MKNQWLFLGFFIVASIGLTILYLFTSRINEMSNFNPSKYYEDKKYSGIVTEKFINKKQHNQQIIIIEKNNEKDTIIFNFVEGNVYEFIREGDSINKKKESLELSLKRNSLDTVIQLKIYNRKRD